MDSAFAWIQQLAAWVGQWVPRWIILDPTMGAVKYVRGSRIVLLGAGVHFYWPVCTVVRQYPVARQADELRAQSMVTTDDKVIVVAGMIVYEVSDLLKLLPTTWSPDATIKDIALTSVHDVVCDMSWDELKAEQRKGTLDTKLKNSAKRALESYGVNVLKVQLTDLAPARVLKLMHNDTNPLAGFALGGATHE